MSHRLRDPKFRVGFWPLNGHVADMSGRGNHGTLVNAPTWAAFFKNGLSCIELDGDDAHVNLGDLTYLNSVSMFTIAFWMNQDVLDQRDIMFAKEIVVENRLVIYTWDNGRLLVLLANGADSYGYIADYSLVISARNWHHLCVVFDGAGVGNAQRLVIYVDGIPVTLGFTGTIPATTNGMATDALIGRATEAFNGKLSDFQIFNVPLTRDEVNQVMHSPQPVY